MTPEEIAALAGQQAEQSDFTNEVEGGDFKKELPKAGICLLRFREYLELGMHPQASKNYPNKKPAALARFVFELCTPHHILEFEKGEGEEKELIRRGHVIVITCPISNSVKSNYIKIFRALNWAGDAKVPAQCLGRPYKGMIYHVFDEKDLVEGKPKKDAEPKYANLQHNQVLSLAAPRKEPDPLAPDVIEEIPVPAIIGDLKVFLWDYANLSSWESLFIDGTRSKKIDGVEQEVSNNWIQEKITEAMNYEGSPLQALLITGGTETLDDLPTKATPDAVEEPPTAEPTGLEGLVPA